MIWDNSQGDDRSVFGRYCAMDSVLHPYVYTQDDDCIVPVGQILAEYKAGELLVNVPEDEERPWLGWGAVFPRELPTLFFKEYLEKHPYDQEFLDWADVIFAEMAFARRIDVGHFDLPWATAKNRMYQQLENKDRQEEVRTRCKELLRLPSSFPPSDVQP